MAVEDGQVLGFCHTGPCQDQAEEPGTGEVFEIYLRPDVAGTGVGRAIFAHAVDDLRARGRRRATLWVLVDNDRGRRFYEAAGWRPDCTVKDEPWGEFTLREMRYRIDL